jgi:DivIVA domain-containing protein
MAIDRTSIERIREATFPNSWAWRGYDKGEVENFLEALAKWLEKNGGSGEQDTSEQELSVQGSAIENMEAKIKELEHELNNAGRRERRLESKLQEVQGRLQTRKAKAKAKGAPSRRPAAPSGRRTPRRRRKTTSSWAKLPRGRLDVNEASFEQFRALGLSVSQCARLIATRDIRGGFKSLDDLDEVEDLSPSAVRELKERLTVGGSSREG